MRPARTVAWNGSASISSGGENAGKGREPVLALVSCYRPRAIPRMGLRKLTSRASGWAILYLRSDLGGVQSTRLAERAYCLGIVTCVNVMLEKWSSSARLKHGPRSLTFKRVFGCLKPWCVMKVKVVLRLRWEPSLRRGGTIARTLACQCLEEKLNCRDPKDGDLCVCRLKPGETLVEGRSDTDVQIVRLICV